MDVYCRVTLRTQSHKRSEIDSGKCLMYLYCCYFNTCFLHHVAHVLDLVTTR
jgi:hypothetical protein